jgi:hypothetical protein
LHAAEKLFNMRLLSPVVGFSEVSMARLWRTVVIVGLCFAAVITMRIYLNKQVELAKSALDSATSRGAVSAQ